ncbi:DUF4349 domain-containing protein [Halorarum salinum]|uniref:DUF4349 domain-containing protein n=1 Tax=Halorarum salinum TaxID=2743089 RepID=A0A7D5Q9D7_9EURY|nr:DUF4349 domain-containing protein [Halobaculum salinum]QLG61597.1 DUF4349 domain-containing protein [Halobaculum salinum]
MRRRHVLVVVVAVALALVLAGCSGAGNDGNGGGGPNLAGDHADTGAPESTQSGDGAGGDDGGGSADVGANVQNREIIYTAEVRLEVDDYDAARENLTAAARERGGYVGDANRQVRGSGNDTFVVGTVTLRVPSGNYSDAMAAVDENGEVLESRESTDDVTDQVVDLRARLDSLRTERDRLRELYEEANDTEEVLAVQRELSDVQTEIERAEARLQSLERQVAYSTITVRIEEPRPDPQPLEGTRFHETPLLQAFLASVDGVVVLLRSAVVFSAYALPYALVLGVPTVAVAALARRRELPSLRGGGNGGNGGNRGNGENGREGGNGGE